MRQNKNSSWLRVNKNNPCPICHKADWCLIAADRAAAICARVESAVEAGNNGAGWVHCLGDSVKPVVVRDVEVHFPLAAIERRDLAYSCLLSELTLSDFHRKNLYQRGLSDGDIADLGYKTISYDCTVEIVQRIKGLTRLAGIPGFYLENGAVKLSSPSGMLIPVRDTEYRIQALQVRCDDADKGKYKWISSNGKHLGCSSGTPIHVSHPEYLQNSEIWITEGALKADIAAIKIQRCILAVAGVANWRGIIPLILELKPSRIVVAFDMDKRTNEMVQCHCQDMEQELLQITNDVFEADWNPDYKGLDDFSTSSTISTTSTSSASFDIFRQISTKG